MHPTACERCLITLLTFGTRHLEAVIKEFLVHYHQAGPHQCLDQRCLAPAEPEVVPLPTGSTCFSASGSSRRRSQDTGA